MPSTFLLARENAVIAPPPPGVTPNYDHPASNGSMYMGSTLTTLILAFLCLILRLSTKITMKSRKLGWDDLLVVLAFLFSTAREICFIVDIYHFGIAHHVWDLRFQPKELWLLHRIGDIMYPPGILCAKVSVLLLYLNIFGHYRTFRISCYVVIAFNVAYLTATTLVNIFWCTPVLSTFGIGYPTNCIDGYKTDLVIGALNLLTDTIVLILPMPVLWTLQLSVAKKIGVAACFSIGAITVAATIVREIEIATKLTDADQTWAVMYEVTWLSVELNTAIIVSCLLISQHFFRHLLVNTVIGQSIQSLLRSGKSSLKSSRKSSPAASRFKEQSANQASKTSFKREPKFDGESYVELRGE
ncbi:hypothetical protein K432DRAFT_396111 [Lepidopterella palustris CBS 459.81]|uniref:Rhodopsin domain-containing protein n=1 Tax=Lepidopterella palustris CBS 459.81 TaxID=1314670 RepID=A0A8E2E3P8_9PEZI|nr:hypothetical protein K432DRAFT_396111 [Lepidopterella palustris CBS 459.81]